MTSQKKLLLLSLSGPSVSNLRTQDQVHIHKQGSRVETYVRTYIHTTRTHRKQNSFQKQAYAFIGDT